MNDDEPLSLGVDLYRERYIKTGRIPGENELRFFFALID